MSIRAHFVISMIRNLVYCYICSSLIYFFLFIFFFFSSRRRHTRCLSDWSSDVCSSDLRKAKGKKRGASMTRSRWPMMIGGLLIAGAAAGAVGALISRRRQQKWQEFGSSSRPAAGFKQEASALADTAKEKASDVLGQVKGTMPPSGDKT